MLIVFDRKTLKEINKIKIPNLFNVITDRKHGHLLAITIRGTYIYRLGDLSQCLFVEHLEAFNRFYYDEENQRFYLCYTDLTRERSVMLKVDLKIMGVEKKVHSKPMCICPLKIENDTLLLAQCDIPTNENRYMLERINLETLSTIDVIDTGKVMNISGRIDDRFAWGVHSIYDYVDNPEF